MSHKKWAKYRKKREAGGDNELFQGAMPVEWMSTEKLEHWLRAEGLGCASCRTRSSWAAALRKARVARELAEAAWFAKQEVHQGPDDGPKQRFGKLGNAFRTLARSLGLSGERAAAQADADGDGKDDALLPDLDNDGIPDKFEDDFRRAVRATNEDKQEDFEPVLSLLDLDGDGVDDHDCDGDGVPDCVEEGIRALEEELYHREVESSAESRTLHDEM